MGIFLLTWGGVVQGNILSSQNDLYVKNSSSVSLQSAGSSAFREEYAVLSDFVRDSFPALKLRKPWVSSLAALHLLPPTRYGDRLFFFIFQIFFSVSYFVQKRGEKRFIIFKVSE